VGGRIRRSKKRAAREQRTNTNQEPKQEQHLPIRHAGRSADFPQLNVHLVEIFLACRSKAGSLFDLEVGTGTLHECWHLFFCQERGSIQCHVDGLKKHKELAFITPFAHLYLIYSTVKYLAVL
jgi:hypothetical protein